MDQSFIPECFVDTNLIETLIPPKKQYNHQKGCGTVTRIMKEKFSDRFAVGIIDKDKKEVKYLEEFEIVYASESLILHKHLTKHHYIIQIVPAMERFILKNVLECNLSLQDFNLPSDFDLLKKESKKTTSKNDQRFKLLFKSLVRNEATEILRLSEWIKYLKDKNYQADLAELKKL